MDAIGHIALIVKDSSKTAALFKNLSGWRDDGRHVPRNGRG
jgi:hypothetical protein